MCKKQRGSGMNQARIFNIQRFSLHDGPGIRTTVFFKGCNLKCRWCHNPESIEKQLRLQYLKDHCILCMECVKACKNGAMYVKEDGPAWDEKKCRKDFKCAEACMPEALKIVGRDISPLDIIKEVVKDKEMYQISGGGLTCSGGEPMLQPEALADILRLAGEEEIPTAVDTAGNVPWSSFEKVIPYTGLFLYDMKFYHSKQHKSYTGAGNELILENLKKLSQRAKIYVRIPVIQGVNTQELKEMAVFLKNLKGVRKAELLPYHFLGQGKYQSLGAEGVAFCAPEEEELKSYQSLFNEINTKEVRS